MSKYSVAISVESRVAGGKVAGAGNRANIRQASQQAQEIRKDMKRKKDPEAQSNAELSRGIGKLQKTLVVLEKSVSRLATSINKQTLRAGRGGGLGTAPPSRGAGVGKGAGLGRVGVAAGYVGIPVAALGFAISKIAQVGRAYIQKSMEQFPTAGVGGFQKSGRFLKSFSAAEYSAYEKEKRTAAGRFDLGPTEYGATDVSYFKKTKGGDLTREVQEPLGIRAATMFGMGTQTGKMAGLARAMSPEAQSGEAFVENIIQKVVRGQRGLTTELPFILNEIVGRMETAVTEGVNASSMAGDMAREIAVMGRGTLTGQARSAARTQKGLMDTQKEVGRNQGKDIRHWQMRLAGRDIIQEAGRGTEGERESFLRKTGLGAFVSQEELGRGMSPEQLRTSIQFLGQSQSAMVRKRYLERTVPKLAGEGTQTEKFARFHVLAQDAGLSTDVAESANLFKRYERGKITNQLEQDMAKRSQLEQDKKAAVARERSAEGQGFFGGLWEGATAMFRETPDEINKKIQKLDRSWESSRNISKRTIYKERMDELAPKNVEAEFKRVEGITGFERGPRAQKLGQGRVERFLMQGVGPQTATAVRQVETAFINLAGTLTGKEGIPIKETISGLSSTIVTLAKGASGAIEGIIAFDNALDDLQTTIYKGVDTARDFLGQLFTGRKPEGWR